MRRLICGLAVAAALGVAPAAAGAPETAFLSSLVGAWSGSGTLKGAETGGMQCSLTFSGDHGGVAYSGQCVTGLAPPQVFRGSLAYNDKTKRFEGTSRGQLTIGNKSGSTVTFVSKRSDGMMGPRTTTMKVAAGKITIDTTVNPPQLDGAVTAHVVMTK